MTELNNEMINAVLHMIRNANTAQVVKSITAKEQIPTLFDKIQAGQQYIATVIKPSIDGQALLRILNENVVAETTLKLTPGQKISVEVVSKEGIIQLKVNSLPSEADIQAQFIKINLPKQQPIPVLLKLLNESLGASSSPDTITSATQITLQKLTSQLIENLPTLNQIKDPAIFQKVLANSGIFLERKLAQGDIQKINTLLPTPENMKEITIPDIKAHLIKISAQIKSMVNDQVVEKQAPTSNLKTSVESQAKQPLINNGEQSKAPITTKQQNISTQQIPQVTNTTSASKATTNPSPLEQRIAPTETTSNSSKKDNIQQPAPTIKVDAVNKVYGQIVTPPTGNSANTQTESSQTQVTQLKGVINKGSLSATQMAQRSMMLGKQATDNQTTSAVQSNVANTSIHSIISMLPKSNLNILLKQLMFKKMIKSEQTQANSAAVNRLSPLADMLRSVESGIARIQTQQLSSVPQDDATRQVWQMEIPLRDKNEISSLMMRFEQDDSDPTTGGTTWTVCLNFNLEETGHIHSKVRLTSDTVSTHFWAENDTIVQKISGYLPRLKEALENLGLNVNHMTSSLGVPPDPVEIVTIEDNLLDENA